MKIGVARMSLFASLVAAAAPASAGSVLVTPPVLADTANVICMVHHLGDDDASAMGTLYQGDGTPVDGVGAYPIYPGLNSPAVGINVTGYYYCSFTGLTKEMRGYLVLNEGGESVLVLPATR